MPRLLATLVLLSAPFLAHAKAATKFTPLANLGANVTGVSSEAGKESASCQSLVMDGKLLFKALGSDAALTPYLEIPVKAPKGYSNACASLTLEAQDIGPLAPNSVTVVAQKGSRTFFLKTSAEVPEILGCQQSWDESEKKSSQLLKQYRDSGLKDKLAFDEHIKAENEGFANFKRCFAENFPKQSTYLDIVKKAQSVANGLARK